MSEAVAGLPRARVRLRFEQVQPLCRLDLVEHVSGLAAHRRLEQRVRKSPSKDRGGGEDTAPLVVEPPQAPPQHEPHALRHVEIHQREIVSPLPLSVEETLLLG